MNENLIEIDLYSVIKQRYIERDVLDKIRVKIEGYKSTIDNAISEDALKIEGMKEAYADCLNTIDKYKAEIEPQESEEINFVQEHKKIPVTLDLTPCDDAISRQAVRDTIFAECSGNKLDIDFAKVLLLQRAIKALPSVNPQPKTGQRYPTQ